MKVLEIAATFDILHGRFVIAFRLKKRTRTGKRKEQRIIFFRLIIGQWEIFAPRQVWDNE